MLINKPTFLTGATYMYRHGFRLSLLYSFIISLILFNKKAYAKEEEALKPVYEVITGLVTMVKEEDKSQSKQGE